MSNERKERKEDVQIPEPDIKVLDMPEDMAEFCVNCGRENLTKYYKGEINHWHQIAERIKKEMDDRYHGSWHCIIGKNFGSFVSFESKR